MTLQEFNLLNEEKKIISISNHGVYLTQHVSGEKIINCFAINLFFTEVVYNKNNEITQIRSFDSGNDLDKYSLDFHFHLISRNIFVGF